MGIQHNMNGTQRGKRSKRSNEDMHSTILLDGDIGSDDGEMGNIVASVDAFQHCTSAPRTEHVRTHTVDEDGERVLPPQEGDSIRYLHLTSSNVNPGDDRTDENAGDLENLMLLFVDMVNKHFYILCCSRINTEVGQPHPWKHWTVTSKILPNYHEKGKRVAHQTTSC